ncbi:MAG: hypothetical protein D5R97_05290 [Candidatus Syntrophonatronum acetioxidans]|uniref:Solute-binding protein family 3/N-terminal domain-containing protein n=1 Tax=Candidatus Syntrophonatronum acetioxidans TaxID=1795816 RepID=A0A424YEI1_9FIRM|nr:MAG: hypothetical protein D5R97_05290 [Candidatus Syntrophonatronum acetioxidans]
MNKNKGYFLLTLTLLLCLFIISGCEQGNLSQEPDSLRFGLLPDITCLPMAVAEKEGIYEELGIQVELVYFSKAMERDQALQAGEIDGAISDFIAVGFFQDSGFDVKITSQNENIFAIVASPYSNINSIADLKGKTVGVSQNTIIEFMVDEILKNHDLTPDDINKEFISAIPLRRELLLQGQIDAACIPEPLGSLSVEQGASMVTDSEEEGLMPSVIIFTQEAIDGKRESIELFYKAYGEAAELINPDPSLYNDLLLEKLRFPEEIIDTYEIPYFAQPFISDKEGAEKYLNWLHGRVDRDLTYDDLVDDSFIDS